MSIPGIGIGIAAVLLAYMGDESRFSTAGQVANYTGFTPLSGILWDIVYSADRLPGGMYLLNTAMGM
jgi:hypothetical protein